MTLQGDKRPQERLTRRKVQRAVHKALKLWDRPTREGLDAFAGMILPTEYGLKEDLSIIDSRQAINSMLLAYISQLERLQPGLAQILILRFKEKLPAKAIAYKLNISIDHLNRNQRLGISYLAELIFDEETRRRKIQKL